MFGGGFVIEALRRDRYVCVTASGDVYEARDAESGTIEKRKLRSYGRGEWFEVPAEQFAMYARIGFHVVMDWYVTDGEYTTALDEFHELDNSSKLAMAKESAITPPESGESA